MDYINNKEFEKLIILYKEDPKKYEDELIPMFDILIGNIMMSFKFKVDLEDAKQECFLLILKTLKNFDPKHGTAFNYFTTIIVNNLKLIYSKNKKYNEKIKQYEENKKKLFDV
jgi:DNA-directed RNA polymerase specialized sigma subunit